MGFPSYWYFWFFPLRRSGRWYSPYMWTFGITLLLWCYFVWLRGSCLIRIWSIYHVGKDEPPRKCGWTRGDIHRVVADFRDAFECIHSFILFSVLWCQQILVFSITYAEEAQHLQLERRAPTRQGRCCRETNCGKVAYRYPARSFRVCRTRNPSWTISRDPLLRAVRFSSTRTPSTLTSASNRSTFTTRGEVCRIILLKENRDVFLQGVLSRASCRLSNNYVKKKGIAKENIQTIRAIVISRNIDLRAGVFNGTAWRCHSRDNISTIDEVFSECLAYAARSPRHGGEPDPSRTIGRTSVFFLSLLALNDFGKWTNMSLFLFLDKLFVYDQVISGTIKLTTTWTFASRNDQRALELELLPGSHIFPWSSSRSDLMSFDSVLSFFPSSRVFSLRPAHHDPPVHTVQQKNSESRCSTNWWWHRTSWNLWNQKVPEIRRSHDQRNKIM